MRSSAKLYIDFHEQNGAKSVALRMDKKEYKDILDAVKSHIGKDVKMLQDEKGKKKEAKTGDKPAEKPPDSSKAGDTAKP
jgi:hypothetical protein